MGVQDDSNFFIRKERVLCNGKVISEVELEILVYRKHYFCKIFDIRLISLSH